MIDMESMASLIACWLVLSGATSSASGIRSANSEKSSWAGSGHVGEDVAKLRVVLLPHTQHLRDVVLLWLPVRFVCVLWEYLIPRLEFWGYVFHYRIVPDVSVAMGSSM